MLTKPDGVIEFGWGQDLNPPGVPVRGMTVGDSNVWWRVNGGPWTMCRDSRRVYRHEKLLAEAAETCAEFVEAVG